MLQDAVHDGIASGLSEPAALEAARDSIVSMFDSIDDEYLRARADDVRDVFARLGAAMCGDDTSSGGILLTKGCILVADELLILPSSILLLLQESCAIGAAPQVMSALLPIRKASQCRWVRISPAFMTGI